MASYVSIANRAAIAVGTSARLLDPKDDTVLGRAVAAVWDIERRAALRATNWNCATKRAELPKLAAKPVHGYEAQFRMPTDSLKLIEVHGGARMRYRLEGNFILADSAGPLRISYLRDLTEPSEFDDGFALAHALRIALAIGNKIAGSAFNERGVWAQYKDALGDAKISDQLENPPIEQEESDWILSRHAGGDTGTLSGWIDGG